MYICDPSRQNGHVGGTTPNWVIDTSLKGYDYGSLSYFIIVKNKLVNKIEEKNRSKYCLEKKIL